MTTRLGTELTVGGEDDGEDSGEHGSKSRTKTRPMKRSRTGTRCQRGIRGSHVQREKNKIQNFDGCPI